MNLAVTPKNKEASAKEVVAFLSGLMRDGEADIRCRLRAAELLGKRLKIFDSDDGKTGAPLPLVVKMDYGPREEKDRGEGA